MNEHDILYIWRMVYSARHILADKKSLIIYLQAISLAQTPPEYVDLFHIVSTDRDTKKSHVYVCVCMCVRGHVPEHSICPELLKRTK